MFDRLVLPLQHAALAAPARWLAARGVAADRITILGFAIGLAAPILIWAGWMGAALAAIALNRLCDGLDGMVARLTRPTRRGAFADIAFDFAFYPLVPLGFALHEPCANALPAAVLIAAFMGTGSSFLAFAALAAEEGRKAADYPTKGIYYLGGLTEGTETTAVLCLMCLFPGAFAWFAYVFAAMCAVTTVTRWRQGWIAFG